jgi:hypothetical protein
MNTIWLLKNFCDYRQEVQVQHKSWIWKGLASRIYMMWKLNDSIKFTRPYREHFKLQPKGFQIITSQNNMQHVLVKGA